ncbi:division/cell wall cluster transcriptional repressor MraZ [Altererythrobacter halimionae]|uniref:Division/cell wall cluster transcriptional repressor MraZ n=1 Tax=Alteriqipengyuania halimionae TaxID=1926630 RepID=A0A6I4U446_9SPHN|nr:division/cell wall cluster transcriptional repressor MraZ [Alteriqipengyuania halimionae]
MGKYSGQGFSLRGEKDRYVLPPIFRKAVKESSEGRVLCLAKHERWNCLVGFGLSRRLELEAQLDREERIAIERDKDFDRDLRAMQLFGFAEIPFDDSGRFVMPEHLAELGKLGDDVYFQGAGGFFTMWNPDQLYAKGEGWEGAQAACRALAAEAAAKAAAKAKGGARK